MIILYIFHSPVSIPHSAGLCHRRFPGPAVRIPALQALLQTLSAGLGAVGCCRMVKLEDPNGS